jgi:hypothetical protein
VNTSASRCSISCLEDLGRQAVLDLAERIVAEDVVGGADEMARSLEVVDRRPGDAVARAPVQMRRVLGHLLAAEMIEQQRRNLPGVRGALEVVADRVRRVALLGNRLQRAATVAEVELLVLDLRQLVLAGPEVRDELVLHALGPAQRAEHLDVLDQRDQFGVEVSVADQFLIHRPGHSRLQVIASNGSTA